MKVLSLFDGMSVARQALENLNIKVDNYYASEIDEYAIAVSQSNWETKHLGSVVGLELKDDIDLLIGGSPCQDLSIAKKGREGLSGSRSGLFYEYVRIRDEIKPKYFILENVASMPNDAKDTISEVLGVKPIMINASLVSAQNRKRLFWVGKLDEFGTYKQVDISQPDDRDILFCDILEHGVTDRDKSYCIDANYYKGTSKEHYFEKGVRQIVFGTCGDFRYDEGFRWRKNGKCPTVSTKGGGALSGSVLCYAENGIRRLTPVECLRLQSMPDNYFDNVMYKGKPISNTQRYKMCGNAFNCEVIMHILKHIFN